MNVYLFIIVPAMAIMCIVFAWIIAGDIKAILRSMRGSGKYDTIRHKIAHLPADVVIDTSLEDVAEVLKREAEAGHPVDVAIDCLGGETLGKALPFVNEGCRWVLISTLAGTTSTIPLRAILTRGINLKGSMLRKRDQGEKAALLARLVRDVWPKLESREIVPTIHAVLPIERAADAHAILERGENVGKVVLKVKD